MKTSDYRADRKNWRLGLACTVMFSLLAVAFPITCMLDRGPTPISAAIFLELICCGFVAMGAYLMIFFDKYRLRIDKHAIKQTGVFSERRIRLENIKSAKWKRRPAGGSLRLNSNEEKMVIEFFHIPQNQKAELIQRLRDAVPGERQSGWSEFEKMFGSIKPPAPMKAREHVWIAIFFSAMACSFLIGWTRGLPVSMCISMAVVNFGFAGWLLFKAKQRFAIESNIPTET
ncbi:MAG: hypothetical protein AB8B55_21750 [Mariniblastus sp.]